MFLSWAPGITAWSTKCKTLTISKAGPNRLLLLFKTSLNISTDLSEQEVRCPRIVLDQRSDPMPPRHVFPFRKVLKLFSLHREMGANRSDAGLSCLQLYSCFLQQIFKQTDLKIHRPLHT